MQADILASLRYFAEEFRIDGFRFDLATVLGPRPFGLQFQLAVLLDAGRRSGAGLREAHRRALGRGPRRLPARQFSGRAGASGTTAIATPCARSGTAAGACSADSRSASPVRRTCSAATAASPPPASTSSPRTTASRCATRCRTTSKHNEANLENNRDGHSNNHSWNCGVEGPTDDAHIIALRRRQVRNMLTTLFFSQGVPMLLAGDELYRTQNGNNNAYCQDNEISWVDWDGLKADDSLLQFVRALSALRRARPELRRDTFLKGALHASHSRDICWWHPAGHEMADQEWNNPDQRCLGVGLGGTASAPDWLLLLNPTEAECEFQPAGSQRAATAGTWCSTPRIPSACCPDSGCPPGP